MSGITTAEAIEALKGRHSGVNGQWANVVEFMYIDFLAVACWQSARFAVHGYEIKVSRSDWLRELKKPGKADNGMSHCDYWSLAAPEGVLRSGELPDKWGYVKIMENSTRQITAPAHLRDDPDPKVSVGPNGGMVRTPSWRSREAFAALARRQMYERTDREEVASRLSDGQLVEALDAAARKTGRLTSRDREQVKRFQQDERERKLGVKSHNAHIAAGVEYDVACPFGWCAQFATMVLLEQ